MGDLQVAIFTILADWEVYEMIFKTKIALISPERRREKSPQAIPYGLASIAGYVLENCKNVDVKIIDGSLNDNIYEELVRFSPNIVGVTANTAQINDAHKILKHCKKAYNSLTVIGGIHVSILATESLPFADIVVVNDGEIVFKRIVDNYKKGVFEHGIIEGEELKNIDVQTPFHLLNVRGYIKQSSWVPILKDPMVMVTSRGCPFKCLFCYNSSRKSSVRYQSPEKVVDDILFLHTKYGVTNFYFGDDSFLINVKRFEKIAELFKKHNIDSWIKWGCQTRSHNLSFTLLELAQKVGLIELSLGLERGDDRLLAILKDNTTVADNEKVFRWCKQLDISVGGGIIFGYFDETKEDMEASFKWFTKQTNLSFVAVGCLIIYPTAQIWNVYRKLGYIPAKVDYEKMLQTNYAFDTYFFLERMNPKKFAERLLHYSRLLRLYAETNRTHSFYHFFFRMSRAKRWWWGWIRHPFHMIKLVYRIAKIKCERMMYGDVFN